MYVSEGGERLNAQPIFTAPAGLHSHFLTWAPNSDFIYFVQGLPPNKMDIWRIKPDGSNVERITSQDTQITYPVFLDRRTLLYLAKDASGAGQWLYGMDTERRMPHPLSYGAERYTSLAADAGGKRLAVTLVSSKRSLWRLPIGNLSNEAPIPVQIPLMTSTGFSPRLGPDYLLYVSTTGAGDSIWKSTGGVEKELWSGNGERVVGGPAISRDGRAIAFSIRQNRRTLLYAMQNDGTSARVVTNSLTLVGAPAWESDGKTISTAAESGGVPKLFHVPTDGRPPAPFVAEYSVDPVWAPGGEFVISSGADVGTTSRLKAFTTSATPHPLPELTLRREARHFAFLGGANALLMLREGNHRRELWRVDLASGTENRLLSLPADFDVRDFDVSVDGSEIVLERVQERSSVLLMDLPKP